MQDRRAGFSVVLVLVIVILLVVGVSAAAFYFLKFGQGQTVGNTVQNAYIPPTPVPYTNSNTFNITSGSSSVPLSNSDTTGSLQQDLNNTKINSPDADINQLNSATSSL